MRPCHETKTPPATFDSSWPFTSPNSTFPFGDSVNGGRSGYEKPTVFTVTSLKFQGFVSLFVCLFDGELDVVGSQSGQPNLVVH